VARPFRRGDPHRRAEERSRAYHRVIAERLRLDRSVLSVARARVRGWLEAEHQPAYARAWSEILNPDRADLIDGTIGELSPFHATYGYYAHGVGESTAAGRALRGRPAVHARLRKPQAVFRRAAARVNARTTPSGD
jgi:hypothetical protein